MISAGVLIWISCRPLLRLVFCVASGIVITKADIFPSAAAGGAGQVVLNITLPCLMFSKIVPAFNATNVNALAPLILVAVLYEALGVVLAYIVKKFFWVPHRFRYGILVAGGWGNVGDIPTAVVMSITGSAPFNGVEDQNLSVAYISAFIFVFMITLFPLGGHKWVAWDFQGPDIEPEEVRRVMNLKRKSFIKSLIEPLRISRWKRSRDQESIGRVTEFVGEKNDFTTCVRNVCPTGRHVSFYNDSSTVVPTGGIESLISSPSSTECNCPSSRPDNEIIMTQHNIPSPSLKSVTDHVHRMTEGQCEQENLPRRNILLDALSVAHGQGHFRRMCFSGRKFLGDFFKALITPSSVAILASFPIAIIPKLKALFVPVHGTYMPLAPDGQPPLAFVLDITTFVGAASVPLGLVCLGSSLARLNVPRKGEWKRLPVGAIIWIAIAKMVVMPILGVLICEGLTMVGVISRNDSVLRFVCIFFSCLPTATVHVLLTQVYSGTGSAEHLSPFLIPQYILMIISMPALTAYALQLVF